MRVRRSRDVVGPMADETTHEIEVEAASMYEAAALALDALRPRRVDADVRGQAHADRNHCARHRRTACG